MALCVISISIQFLKTQEAKVLCRLIHCLPEVDHGLCYPDDSEERVVYSLRCWECSWKMCSAVKPIETAFLTVISPPRQSTSEELRSKILPLCSQGGISKAPFHPQGSRGLQWEFSFCLIFLPCVLPQALTSSSL